MVRERCPTSAVELAWVAAGIIHEITHSFAHSCVLTPSFCHSATLCGMPTISVKVPGPGDMMVTKADEFSAFTKLTV